MGIAVSAGLWQRVAGMSASLCVSVGAQGKEGALPYVTLLDVLGTVLLLYIHYLNPHRNISDKETEA